MKYIQIYARYNPVDFRIKKFNGVFVFVWEGDGSEPLGAMTPTPTLIELAIAGWSLFYI